MRRPAAASAMRPFEALAAVRVGDTILVRHAGDQEWHERLVMAVPWGKAGWRAVLIPNEDHYGVSVAEEYEEVRSWAREEVSPRGG